MCSLDVGRLTEKPNRYPIFKKIDTDTDFGILKTGKYRIPTKNNRKKLMQLVMFLSPETIGLPMFYNRMCKCKNLRWLGDQ